MLNLRVCGAIAWRQSLVMLLRVTIGGYGGAQLGRVLPGRLVRGLTLATTAAITALFFHCAYL